MNDSARIHIGRLLIGIGVVSLVAFGIAGVGRTGPRAFDLASFYSMGTVWARGEDPYVVDNYVRATQELPAYQLEKYAAYYPPQAAALFVPISFLPFPVAAA